MGQNLLCRPAHCTYNGVAYPETLQSVKAPKMLASSWSFVLGGRRAHDTGAPLQMESSLEWKAAWVCETIPEHAEFH